MSKSDIFEHCDMCPHAQKLSNSVSLISFCKLKRHSAWRCSLKNQISLWTAYMHRSALLLHKNKVYEKWQDMLFYFDVEIAKTHLV